MVPVRDDGDIVIEGAEIVSVASSNTLSTGVVDDTARIATVPLVTSGVVMVVMKPPCSLAVTVLSTVPFCEIVTSALLLKNVPVTEIFWPATAVAGDSVKTGGEIVSVATA